VLASSTSSINFSSIPSGFQHLQIRCDVRSVDGGSAGNYANLRLNGDTGNNYGYKYVETTPSVANSAVTNGTGNIDRLYSSYFSNNGGSATGYFASMIIDLWDYSNTNKYKIWRCYGGWHDRSVGRHSSMAGHWLSNSAVNAISIAPQGTSWVAGSTFALYGIKNV
jgi:hypothetical protein